MASRRTSQRLPAATSPNHTDGHRARCGRAATARLPIVDCSCWASRQAQRQAGGTDRGFRPEASVCGCLGTAFAASSEDRMHRPDCWRGVESHRPLAGVAPPSTADRPVVCSCNHALTAPPLGGMLQAPYCLAHGSRSRVNLEGGLLALSAAWVSGVPE